MGLEKGIPKALLLGWAYRQMEQDGAFTHVAYDEAMEQVLFTVRAESGVERRYKLAIERGWPVVEQVEGPAETR
jgi:hypothetical protein